MLIVPDANALFSDPLLTQFPACDVLNRLQDADARLVLSPIVVGELERQYRDGVSESNNALTSRLRRFERQVKIDTSTIRGEIESVVGLARERWASRQRELGEHPNVLVARWPNVSAQEMVLRELAGKRPFQLTAKGTIGHRDAVLWLGVVSLAARHLDEVVVLVTSDKGFLGPSGLHPDLLEDLDAAGVSRARVRRVGTMHGVRTLLEEQQLEIEQEVERDDRRGWRAAKLQDLVIETVGDLPTSFFAPTWNMRDGGYDDPEFDIALPSDVDEWTSVEVVDEPLEPFLLGEVPLGEGSLDGSFAASFVFSGYMNKADWYAAGEHAGVELWDADMNDTYVQVHVERELEFDVRFDFGEDDEDVAVDRFLAVRLEQRDAAH